MAVQQQVCGSSEGNYAQIPNLWGSEQPVWARNFVPVDLANFTVRFPPRANCPVCCYCLFLTVQWWLPGLYQHMFEGT